MSKGAALREGRLAEAGGYRALGSARSLHFTQSQHTRASTLLRRPQHATAPDTRFLTRHPSLNAKMRAILADWLVDVCLRFRQVREPVMGDTESALTLRPDRRLAVAGAYPTKPLPSAPAPPTRPAQTPDTLFRTLALVDRYLSLAPSAVPRGQLQLVGITALLLASKFEEVCGREV